MDGISNVASALAILSAATELLARLAKLHKFWKNIKDVPQDIESILHDLQQLCVVIEYVVRQQRQQGPLDVILESLVNTCTQRVQAFRSFLEKYNIENRSTKKGKRMWVKIKAVEHKDRIAAFRQSLGEAKSTLTLALQLSQGSFVASALAEERNTIRNLASNIERVEIRQESALRHDEHLIQICSLLHTQSSQELPVIHPEALNPRPVATARIGGVSLLPSEDLANRSLSYCDWHKIQAKSGLINCSTRRNSIFMDSCVCLRTPIGSVVFQTVTEIRDVNISNPTPPRRRQHSLILVPTSWAVFLGLVSGAKITFSRCHCSWKYVISPIRSVSDDGAIFAFSKDGNIPAMQELISSGVASVLDTDSYGRQPIHFAFREKQLEMAKFLIRNGAKVSVYTNSGETVLTYTSLASRDWVEFILLAEEMVDFSSPNSSGWELLYSFEVLEHGCSLSSCLEWLFSRYSTQMCENQDWRGMYHALIGAVTRHDCKAARIILDLYPQVVKYRGASISALQLLPYQSYSGIDMLGVLMDYPVDLHEMVWDQTATSAAMKYWSTFRIWKSQLLTRLGNLNHFLMQETNEPKKPLSNQGWSLESLQRLFALPFLPSGTALPDPLFCYHCGIRILRWDRSGVLVDPWWEHLIDRLKRRYCVCHCLKNILEWLEPSNDCELQSLCGLHLPTRINYVTRNQNKIPSSESCKTCSFGNSVSGSYVDDKKMVNPTPEKSLVGVPYIHTWPKGICESFYKWSTRKPKFERSHTSGHARPGHRKTIRTRDWEEAMGERFPRYGDIMAQFSRFGGWRKRYMPGQLYCFHCMSMFEDWPNDESCSRVKDAEERSTAMPGSFPLP